MMKVVVRKSRSSEHYLEVVEVIDEEKGVNVVLESSAPISHDEVVREVTDILTLKEKLEQPIEPKEETKESLQPPLEFSPQLPPIITHDIIVKKLRNHFRSLPEDTITMILIKGASRVGLGHQKIHNANPEELQQLHDFLFSHIGEDGVQNVLATESVLAGKMLEIPKDQNERAKLLANARHFVRTHPILSTCPEVDKRIDYWTGAFYVLYEYYRLLERK